MFTAATTRPAASCTGTATDRTPCFELLVDHAPSATAGALDTSPRRRSRSTIVRSVNGASVASLEVVVQLIIRKGGEEYPTH